MIQKSISATLPRDRAFGIIVSLASTLSVSFERENCGAEMYPVNCCRAHIHGSYLECDIVGHDCFNVIGSYKF